MTTTVPTPPEVDEPRRLRVCSLSGIAGSVLVLVAFFLPWVRIDEGVAENFHRSIEQSEVDPPAEVRADWLRMAEEIEQRREVTGLDVFYWARTAVRTASSGALPEGGSTELAARAIRVVAVWLAAVPLLALLLSIYFLLHHCRKARSPALILATLAGAAAMAIPAAHEIFREALAGVTAERGLSLLLAGGALLFLAGTFGVRLRNWWRVFGGALLVGALLVGGVLGYVRG
jgi:hypothetical protein